MDFKMKCRIGFGIEKTKSVHLWCKWKTTGFKSHLKN